jgi:hypothetical protein
MLRSAKCPSEVKSQLTTEVMIPHWLIRPVVHERGVLVKAEIFWEKSVPKPENRWEWSRHSSATGQLNGLADLTPISASKSSFSPPWSSSYPSLCRFIVPCYHRAPIFTHSIYTACPSHQLYYLRTLSFSHLSVLLVLCISSWKFSLLPLLFSFTVRLPMSMPH